MALIQCPECGKEISDKASTCPNCGCPIKVDKPATDNSSEIISNTNDNKAAEINQASSSKTNNKTPIIIVGVVIAVIVIVLLAVKMIPKKEKVEEITTEATTEDNSKEIYDEAMELIESGKYEDAKEKFETISDYKDVSTILDQIPWETRAFVCIDQLKDMLKSPDSLKVYDIVFFSKEQKEDAKLEQERLDGLKEVFDSEETAPVIVIHYGGENTMGGMTDQVTVFVCDKKTHQYVPFGHTKTLEKEKAKDDEENVVLLFDTMNENFERIGDVDTNRINAIIKSGVYTNVKIIDD